QEYGFFPNNDINILRCISKYELKYQSQPTALKISKQLNITQATITPMIDRLVKNNYIHRIVSPIDKRAKLLSITQKGRDLLSQSKSQEKEQLSKLVSYLGEEDTLECIRLLKKVSRYLGKNNET
ncbi:MAG: MarR family transcriptional regulator, partial [bacterium]